ncbi:MAG: hypothetical protein NVS4B12_00710 [Ktedonobacteraceae bacterium]
MVYVVLFIFALVGSALVVLTVENLATQVQFAVFAWQSPNVPLGLVVLIAFILGALLLYIVSALSALRDRSEKRRLRKRVSELEQQLATLTPATPQSVIPSQTPVVPMPGVGIPPQRS